MKKIDRREALKRSAYILGGTLMAPTIAGVLKGCSPKPELTWTPQFFNENQARIVTSVADIILPATDTPAASELGVPGFIEEMINIVAKAETRDSFLANLDAFDKEAKEKMGSAFVDLSPEEQGQFVSQKHQEMVEGEIDWNNRPFMWSIKELTITGYCLTEVGSTQLLQHVMIPTRYDGCIPLEEAGKGKTWAM